MRPHLQGVRLAGAAAAALGLMVWSGVAAGQSTSLRITQDNQGVSIVRDGRPVLQYAATGVPFKPYVKELYTPGGVQILRDSPQDHKHHHALMFAVGVDGVTYWAETPKAGRQVQTALEDVKGSSRNGDSLATFTQRLDWIGPEDQKVLCERRTIEVRGVQGVNATLLTWRSYLEPAAGKKSVTLGGSHYYGLGMRFVASMDQAGRFVNSESKEGSIVRGSERLAPSKWCAYTSAADGKPVTVALFDGPKNPRPALFFTMRPFAYLSATLNLSKEPMTLKAGEALDLCYGVAVWDGEIEPAQVQDVCQKWTQIESK